MYRCRVGVSKRRLPPCACTVWVWMSAQFACVTFSRSRPFALPSILFFAIFVCLPGLSLESCVVVSLLLPLPPSTLSSSSWTALYYAACS